MATALQDAAAARDELKHWLLHDAYPLWWEHGMDRVHGGFHESLGLGAEPLHQPRRVRVQARQLYAFSLASEFGWSGPATAAVEHGLHFFLQRFLRADGLCRTLTAHDGAMLNNAAKLYDQGFALLGFAAAFRTLGRRAEARERALRLRDQLHEQFRHGQRGFEETVPATLPRLSNSHMHLLEACLAWAELDSDPAWRALVEEIVVLAVTRFIGPGNGPMREYFARDWSVIPGERGRIIEPGHHFEWAWLLLSDGAREAGNVAVNAGLRLLDIGEMHGVDSRRGVAVNALLDDFSVRDPEARLWPQTERLKAACRAALVTGQGRYWSSAAAAARALQRYLATPMRGLWRDRMRADGSFVIEAVPASSFYHIVDAIAQLDQAIG